MELEKTGSSLIVRFSGEINSQNAPDMVKILFRETDGITKVTFDMKYLEYISSAGIRMLLSIKKIMKDQMFILNINDELMRIFEVAGLKKVLGIE